MGGSDGSSDDGLFEWLPVGEPQPPRPGQALGQFLLERMRLHAAADNTKPAQIDASGAAKSYPELLRESVQAAEGWRALGVSSTDSVAFYARNGHAKYAALLGAMLEGITLATFEPTTTEDEMRLLLSRVDVRAMVCEPANLQVALTVLPVGVAVFVTAEVADPSWPAGVRAVPELLRCEADVDAYRAAEVSDPRQHAACITFSSGSTGLPKGVAITDYGIILNATTYAAASGTNVDPALLHALADTSNAPALIASCQSASGGTCIWQVLPEDQVLVVSPVSWITGLMYTVIPIVLGATRVVWTYTNEEECLDMLRRFEVTMTFLAPARFMLLAGLMGSLRRGGAEADVRPPHFRLPHFRRAVTGGSTMTAAAQRACSEALGAPVAQSFGCTEVLLVSGDHGQPPRYGSAGKLAPGVRARLVDVRTGREIREPSVEGELRLKSPSLMLGYVRDPEATASAIDEHGWYRTGDVARIDTDGYLYITGRIKEMLKYMNVQMTPAEIEGVLASHPAVKAACVVGRPHPVAGDIPTAFVMLLPGKQATELELQELVRARLQQHKQLRGGVFFVDEVPLSVNGKYDRITLRNRLSKLPPVPDFV